MEFYNYLTRLEEMRKLSSTMVGFKVPLNQVQKASEHIRSLLNARNIDYKYNQTPHITIAMITGKYRKDELTKSIQKTRTKLTFKFKKLSLFDGHYTGRSYIVMELNKHDQYREIVDYFNNKFPEFKAMPGGMLPHISLVNTEMGAIDNELWNEILNTTPVQKTIQTKGIDLYSSKFQVAYSFKGKR